jgi:ABC-type transporter Mla MlaB component
MLRITTKSGTSVSEIVLVVEGKLVKAWVGELRRCWRDAAAVSQAITVNLAAVSFVDSEGEKLLTEMHSAGVKITGSGVMVRALIQEITSKGKF